MFTFPPRWLQFGGSSVGYHPHVWSWEMKIGLRFTRKPLRTPSIAETNSAWVSGVAVFESPQRAESAIVAERMPALSASNRACALGTVSTPLLLRCLKTRSAHAARKSEEKRRSWEQMYCGFDFVFASVAPPASFCRSVSPAGQPLPALDPRRFSFTFRSVCSESWRTNFHPPLAPVRSRNPYQLFGEKLVRKFDTGASRLPLQ